MTARAHGSVTQRSRKSRRSPSSEASLKNLTELLDSYEAVAGNPQARGS